MKNRLLYIILCLALGQPLFAQKKCKDALNRSEKLYQEGKFQEAVKTLEPCLNTLKTDEEKFEAYRLLGICYQFLNKTDKAVPYVYKMLYLQPDYHKYPNIDPVEFTQLVNKFHVSRKLFAGIRAGFNSSSVNVLNNYIPIVANQEYSSTIGYQLGITGEYYYKPYLSFYTDLSINQFYIDHYIHNNSGLKQTNIESQQYFSFLVGASYYRTITGDLKVFTGLAGGFSYLIDGIANLETENAQLGEILLSTKETTDERIRTQPFVDGKLGVSYPLGRGYVNFDITYRYYFSNLIDADKRLSDIDFINTNKYINNDIRLQSIMFNLTYKIPLIWSIEYE